MSQIIRPAEFASPLIHRPVDDSCVLWLCGRGSRRQGTFLADLSGNGNHGTIDGATWANGPAGQSVLSLDGADDKVQLTNTITQSIGSYVFWINSNDLTSEEKCVLLNEVTYSRISFLTTKKIFIETDTNGETFYFNDYAFSENVWTQVVLSRDGDDASLYIDGMFVQATNVNGADALTVGYIGGKAGARFFSGLIGEVRIYKRALSASEISGGFQNTRHWYGV